MRIGFDRFELNTDSFSLLEEGTPKHTEPLAFNLLCYLIEHRDRCVTRDELFEQL